MRVIGGELSGRHLDAPKGHRTHPMGDRVRGGLFNALGDITGLTVLDAFAGSGALSIEAISRGADSAVAIDIDKSAHTTIVKNIASLDLKKAIKAIRANASGWSDNNSEAVFDLVLSAPPYDNLQLSLVEKLTRHVKAGGLYVLDWPGNMPAPVLPGVNQIKENSYGDAKLVFYRQTG